MTVRVEPFTADNRDAFMCLHSVGNGAGWCRCVAWWVSTWDGWGDRSAAENAELRRSLCARGEYDGLLAYVGGESVGWCQLGPRDRLRKLVAQLGLEPDESAWAVTCFFVAPAWRGAGVSTALLRAAVGAARAAGAAKLEGYPRTAAGEPGEQWTGPAALFAAVGFVVVRSTGPRDIVSLEL